jgi:hypothetical protein
VRKRAAAVVLTGLVACSACLGPVDDVSTPAPASSAPSPAPEDPGAGSITAKWTEFVRMARQERLPRRTWPSTAKNASVTAAIMCHNPASHGATEVDLYHGTADWADVREGDILFARAFCPEAEAELRQALSGKPGSPHRTTVPAVHFGPGRE